MLLYFTGYTSGWTLILTNLEGLGILIVGDE